MKCNHLFEHKITKDVCLNQKDKKIYDWLTHKCKKCGLEACCGKLEKPPKGRLI